MITRNRKVRPSSVLSSEKHGPVFDIQIVRRGIPPKVLKRRINMSDNHNDPGNSRLLLTYDPLSRCDADPEAKNRRILVDAVVASVYDGGNCPPYEVEDLIEKESAIYDGEVDWLCPVSMRMVEEDLSDLSLREYAGLSDKDEITDEMRLSHGLSVIENLLNDGLQGDQPAASAVRILDTWGRACFIAFELQGYSFSGVDCETIGAFKDEQEIHIWYRQNGYMISHDDLEGAKAKILATWEYDDQYSAADSDPFASHGNVIDLDLERLQRNAWKFFCETYPDRVDLSPESEGALQSTAKEEKSHE
jgi:hypothetical protein